MDDISRLKQKIKERLKWSDIQLMRSILVFLGTQSWQKSFSDDCSNGRCDMLDEFAEVRAAVEYIISTFRISTQDEVEDVSYARKHLPLGSENYHKSGTNFTLALTSAGGPTF